MSITVVHASGVSHSVDQVNFTPANWVVVDTKESDDKLSRETVYQQVSPVVSPPPTMRIGIYKNPKALGGFGQTNYSVKLMGSMIITDASGASIVHPLPITKAWSIPGVDGIPATTSGTQTVAALAIAHNVIDSVTTPIQHGDDQAQINDMGNFLPMTALVNTEYNP